MASRTSLVLSHLRAQHDPLLNGEEEARVAVASAVGLLARGPVRVDRPVLVPRHPHVAVPAPRNFKQNRYVRNGPKRRGECIEVIFCIYIARSIRYLCVDRQLLTLAIRPRGSPEWSVCVLPCTKNMSPFVSTVVPAKTCSSRACLGKNSVLDPASMGSQKRHFVVRTQSPSRLDETL